jgi:ribulose bisphosphate carboxylase small subunit
MTQRPKNQISNSLYNKERVLVSRQKEKQLQQLLHKAFKPKLEERLK